MGFPKACQYHFLLHTHIAHSYVGACFLRYIPRGWTASVIDVIVSTRNLLRSDTLIF